MKLLFFIACVFVGSLSAQSVYLTPEDNFAQFLTNHTFSGETVFLSEVTITGVNPETTILKYNSTNEASTLYFPVNTKITLEKITLTGGHNGLEARTGSSVTIRNCIFDNVSTDNNWVLELYFCNTTIENTTFVNNGGNSIYTYRGQINITHSHVEDTSMYCGGIGDDGVCRVDNTVLTKNSPLQANAGTFFISNSIFSNTSSTYLISGHTNVALFVDNITVAEGSGIVAINFANGKPGRLSNSRISGKFSTLVRNTATILTMDSNVIGPIVDTGIGFFAESSSTTYIKSSLIQGIKATSSPVLVSTGSKVEISETTFIGNSALDNSSIIRVCENCKVLLFNSISFNFYYDKKTLIHEGVLQGNSGVSEQISGATEQNFIMTNTIIDKQASSAFCCSSQFCSYPTCDSTCPEAQGCHCPFIIEPQVVPGNLSSVSLGCNSSPTDSPTNPPTSSPTLPPFNISITITITITISIDDIDSLNLDDLIAALATLLSVSPGDITIDFHIIVVSYLAFHFYQKKFFETIKTNKRATAYALVANIKKSISDLNEIGTMPAETQTKITTALLSPSSPLSLTFSSANATVTQVPTVDGPTSPPSPSPSPSPSSSSTSNNEESSGCMTLLSWVSIIVFIVHL